MFRLNRRSFMLVSIGVLFSGVKPLMSIAKINMSDTEWQSKLNEQEY